MILKSKTWVTNVEKKDFEVVTTNYFIVTQSRWRNLNINNNDKKYDKYRRENTVEEIHPMGWPLTLSTDPFQFGRM